MNDRERKRLLKWLAELLSSALEVPTEHLRGTLDALEDVRLRSLSHDVFVHVATSNMRYATEVCSRHGWFVDVEFPAASSVTLANLYESGQEIRADDALVEYYRDRCDSIQSALVSNYPERSVMLTKAFQFHFDGEYDVSIPLFLIQADGVCSTAFGGEFFRVRRGALAVQKHLAGKNVDWVWNAMLQPFCSIPPVAAHSRKGRRFNRHRILHGLSLDYGSEANSLRTISLLAFLHGLDSYSRRKAVEQSQREYA